MTNRKTTKRALLMSVLSMFLCLTMLVGTTFAWFTDEVKSGTNTIVAGNLDVELYNAIGVDENAKIDEETMLFELEGSNLWEPGVMVYENLTVANEGTLALKYRLSVTIGESDLCEALKVAVVDGGIAEGTTRNSLQTIDGYIGLESFFVTGELLAGTEEEPTIKTYGIVIWWEPTDEDNKFNMKDGAEQLATTIGVDLFATQIEAEMEKDSFGSDYDKNANLIISGEYVAYENVDKKITINEGENATIKLNNNTVSNTIINNGTVTLSGGTIEVGAAGIITEGSATLENVDMNAGSTVDYANIARGPEATATYNNVNVDSAGGGVGAVGGAQVTFNSGSVEVDSKSTSGRYLFYTEGAGSKITINGGNFDFNKTQNQKRAYVYASKDTTVEITGGTFGKASTRSGYTAGILGEGTVIITGGTFGFDPTTWVAAGYKAEKANGVWTVSPKVTDNAGLNDAIANGDTAIGLGAGEYTLPTTTGDITISGTKDTVITVNKPKAENVAFNGVTVVGSGYATGIQHSKTVVYENCVIKGVQCLYADNVVIKNCVIDLTDVVDYIWTYGAKNVEFIDCTFNTNGKAILIYNESKDLVTNVTVKGCTFNATASALASGNVAAAIEIDSSLATNGHYTLTTEDNVVDSDFSGEWRIKKSGTDNTTVNGVVYNAITIDGVLQ